MHAEMNPVSGTAANVSRLPNFTGATVHCAGEIMDPVSGTATNAGKHVLTRLTLALLEDTGWCASLPFERNNVLIVETAPFNPSTPGPGTGFDVATCRCGAGTA